MVFFPDHDSKMMLDLLDGAVVAQIDGRPMHIGRNLPPEEFAFVEEFIRERKAMVESGLRRVPSWFQESLNRAYPDLRAWWDDWRGEWIIDRLQSAATAEALERAAKSSDQATAESLRASAAMLAKTGPYYLTVVKFAPGDCYQGTEEPIDLNRRFIEWLKANDMSRYSPEEIVAMKEGAAAMQALENEKAAQDGMRAVIDGMSRKEIHEFIEVSKAIQTGEKIIAHGDDEKWLDGINESGRKLAREAELRGEPLPDVPSTGRAVNPGANPLIRQPERKSA